MNGREQPDDEAHDHRSRAACSAGVVAACRSGPPSSSTASTAASEVKMTVTSPLVSKPR